MHTTIPQGSSYTQSPRSYGIKKIMGLKHREKQNTAETLGIVPIPE